MRKTSEKTKVKKDELAKKSGARKFRKGSIEALESFRGCWVGGDKELTRLLAESQQLRNA